MYTLIAYKPGSYENQCGCFYPSAMHYFSSTRKSEIVEVYAFYLAYNETSLEYGEDGYEFTLLIDGDKAFFEPEFDIESQIKNLATEKAVEMAERTRQARKQEELARREKEEIERENREKAEYKRLRSKFDKSIEG